MEMTFDHAGNEFGEPIITEREIRISENPVSGDLCRRPHHQVV